MAKKETICEQCKYYNDKCSLFYPICKFKKEKIIGYVYRQNIPYSGVYPYCKDKNINGECHNYMPLGLEDRLDFLLEQGRKRLINGIEPIFMALENYWSYFNCFSRSIIQSMAAAHDIPKKFLETPLGVPWDDKDADPIQDFKNIKYLLRKDGINV